ncbi:MAG: hypothetical protein IT352_18395, partial [Gemmatimonadales bacterium]|nr:hypothetical protein [Gemmatimonadales bacterium]
IAVMALVGALIGAAVLGMAASVRAEGVGIGVALGALLGVVGGVVGSLGGLLLAGATGLGGRRYRFRFSKSLIAAFSRARSAYIRLSLAFSALSSFNRWSSAMPAPPCFQERRRPA